MSRAAVACVLLTACSGGSRASRHGDLGFVDTETVGKARYAAYVAEQASTQAAASTLVRAAPVLIGLMQQEHDADELEKGLAACAVQAEQEGNARYFHDRPPTRQECAEVVEKDRCGNPVTRAMFLGRQKHVLALQCAEQVLRELWPAPFSIEQRYRYYPNARMVESISKEKEARLLADGCTEELRGTIKPDIVLHEDRSLLLKSVLTLDFKFPCPDTNGPTWTRYDTGSYAGRSQRTVYEEALGGQALLISPRTGVKEVRP